ncbi:hypothetical protein B0H16DRAFT_1467093 [Mycena metata]|uniref:Uncharacterized protein n=1 Tax=Mycena metata TaxID=1033252 RepID=A0AAD7MWS3_9AGAR|nr:hypothetical protein B0H16DRAFT_1467093 [Mycena metata]
MPVARISRVYDAKVGSSFPSRQIQSNTVRVTIPAAVKDIPIRAYQQASLAPRPSYTPVSSPNTLPRLASTLDVDIFVRPSSPTGSLTESETEVMDDIFRWDDYEDEEHRAAGKWITTYETEWIDNLNTEEVVREAEAKTERNASEWVDKTQDYWYAEKQIEATTRRAESIILMARNTVAKDKKKDHTGTPGLLRIRGYGVSPDPKRKS